MKRFFALVLMLSLFVTTTAQAATAQGIGALVKEYKINTRVLNVNPQQALNQLTEKLIAGNYSADELIAYAQRNLSAVEQERFNAIVSYGKQELRTMHALDASQFQVLLSEALASTDHLQGANYSGCGVMVGIGMAASIGAIVVGLLAMDARGHFGDLILSDEHADELGYTALALGIVSTVFSTAAWLSC